MLWGDPDVFQWLLNAHQGFLLSCQGHRVSWTSRVNLEMVGLSDLLYKICNRQIEMVPFVSALVTAKADVAGMEGTRDLAIHAAARRGHTGIVRVLLTNGANVDAQNHIHQMPLHLAFRYGHKGACAAVQSFCGAPLLW